MRILFGFTLACVVSSCAWTDHSPENGWYEGISTTSIIGKKMP